jgi:hypothetical protein
MLRIDRMFAFVATDGAGDEGVCAFMDPATGVWMPLVGADIKRVESLRAEAQVIADLTGRRIEILEFSTRKAIGTVTPEGSPKPTGPLK